MYFVLGAKDKEMRICKVCLETKDDDCFTLNRNKNGKNYRRQTCDACRAEKHRYRCNTDPEYKAKAKAIDKKSREKHKEKNAYFARCYLMIHKYGITLKQKEKLLELQGGRCAICLSTDPGARGWQTDHDKKYETATGKIRIRGIVCQPCNLTLGVAKESHDRLNRCRRYLRFHGRQIMGGIEWLDLWPQGGMVSEEITAKIGAL
jgi:hypothetical protein